MPPVPRILYLLDDLGGGGAQRQAVETSSHLVGEDLIEASFLTYHEDDFFAPRLDEAGIPRSRVKKRLGLDPLFPKRLRAAISEQAPHLVHAFMRGPSVWASQALRGGLGHSSGALVVSERNAFVDQGRLQALALGRAFKRADAITANAAFVAAEIPTRFRVDAAKVHYIPNGIDLAAWDALMDEPAPHLSHPTRFQIGIVGRLVPQKNHPLFLRALGRVEPEVRADWQVSFIGEGGGAHGCEGEIRTDIEALGLSDVVQIIEPRNPIAPVMKAFDLLVLSSSYEGFPNVVLEAMASRTPVVATGVGDVENLMGDKEGGLVVPAGDEAALSDALVHMARLQPGEREGIGAQGRSRVEAHFQMEAVAARYLALYDQVLGRAVCLARTPR